MLRISDKCETLKGRLPPEDGSVRPQTLGKRVSDDPRHFIFRRPKIKIGKHFRRTNFRTKIRQAAHFGRDMVFWA